MAKDEPIVTFRSYFDPMLAHIERAKLEDNDIPCFIADENMAVMNALYNTAIGGIKLKVFERDIEKCEAILNADVPATMETTDADVQEAMDAITCVHCGSGDVRYGDATEKKYDRLSIIISFWFMTHSRKAWHCFNCGKDFNP